MLKDEKNKWVEELEISEDLWKKIMHETLSGILALVDSVEKLLNNGGDATVCSGLYMYAVEEYGKLQLLMGYNPSAGKVKVNYSPLTRRASTLCPVDVFLDFGTSNNACSSNSVTL
jgi:hypothetical protein